MFVEKEGLKLEGRKNKELLSILGYWEYGGREGGKGDFGGLR